jgi:polysaccharide pyruvyl transferase WcaK-like protein
MVQRQQRRRSVRIAFYGNFGQGNLGNEGTLRAILDNLRKALPDAQMQCICTGPAATRITHHIEAVPIHENVVGPELLQGNAFAKIIRKVLIGLPIEFYRWIHAIKTLGATDLLIVPGTQYLSDNLTGPWGGPYLLFRWSVAAKLRRCKLAFASVGVGPLHHRSSRFFIKTVLRLADFRSYRDHFSKEYLQKIGFNSGADPVFPDLAFSLLSVGNSAMPRERSGRPVVALGVLDHHGQLVSNRSGLSPEETYRRYVDRTADLARWLLEQGYLVRLVIGDVTYDRPVVLDIQDALKREGANTDGRLIAEPIESLEDLLSQFSKSDFVISPRFHNIVFGLLLNRPVLALSYHEKFAALLESPHLAKFNLPIEYADAGKIQDAFCELTNNRTQVINSIGENVKRYRASLAEQYEHIIRSLDLERGRSFWPKALPSPAK